MKVKSRYGHKKGLTSLYVDLSSNSFVTCGNDNDVRIWRSIDDEEVVDFNVGRTGAALACHGDTFYICATDGGFVKAYDKATGQLRDGNITNFRLPVTHIVVSPSGEKLLVSSREIGAVRWVNLADRTFKALKHHGGQILSVALDPKQQYAATSSGDGSVRISLLSSGDCVHTIPNILMKTNELRTDRPLTRLCWQPNEGAFLAVPVRGGVQLYKRECGWILHKTLQYQMAGPGVLPQQMQHPQEAIWFSVCAYSSCGNYLAAGSISGEICLWNTTSGELLLRKQLSKKAHICAIAWHPIRKDEILYCDVSGEVGALSELILDAPAPDQLIYDGMENLEERQRCTICLIVGTLSMILVMYELHRRGIPYVTSGTVYRHSREMPPDPPAAPTDDDLNPNAPEWKQPRPDCA